MSLVRNEQLKLTATYLNGVAIATIAIGCLAPIVAGLSSAVPAASVPLLLALGAVCAGISVGIGTAAVEGPDAMTAHDLLLFTAPVGALIVGLLVYWLYKPSAHRN